MKILFVGDIFGKPGRAILSGVLSSIVKERGIDFVIINCENAASGKGLTVKTMNELFGCGVDGMTSGNHIWDKGEIYEYLSSELRIVRPENSNAKAYGQGSTVIEKNGKRLGLINIQGQVFMPPVDSPFYAVDAAIDRFANENIPILVDFHAEATSEKIAMGYYLDGRVAAVVGTHTHVQTADETVLPGGTAYISDVGMTGGHGGVIGVKREIILHRYLDGLPAKFEVSEESPRLNAVVIEIDDESCRAVNIARINEPYCI